MESSTCQMWESYVRQFFRSFPSGQLEWVRDTI